MTCLFFTYIEEFDINQIISSSFSIFLIFERTNIKVKKLVFSVHVQPRFISYINNVFFGLAYLS